MILNMCHTTYTFSPYPHVLTHTTCFHPPPRVLTHTCSHRHHVSSPAPHVLTTHVSSPTCVLTHNQMFSPTLHVLTHMCSHPHHVFSPSQRPHPHVFSPTPHVLTHTTCSHPHYVFSPTPRVLTHTTCVLTHHVFVLDRHHEVEYHVEFVEGDFLEDVVLDEAEQTPRGSSWRPPHTASPPRRNQDCHHGNRSDKISTFNL